MGSDSIVPQRVTLKRDLIGQVPYCPANFKTVPGGAEVKIVNANYTLTDSVIEWEGHELIVKKESLMTF
jgi:hypothetical protein